MLDKAGERRTHYGQVQLQYLVPEPQYLMAPQFPNYYEVLGLDDKKCSTDEVRTAYRRESLR